MRDSTLENLRSLAPIILKGASSPYPLPAYATHAIAILKILDDGQWHTAASIGEELGLGKKYVRDILRACKEPWGLAIHNPKGWMLVKPDSVIIV